MRQACFMALIVMTLSMFVLASDTANARTKNSANVFLKIIYIDPDSNRREFNRIIDTKEYVSFEFKQINADDKSGAVPINVLTQI